MAEARRTVRTFALYEESGRGAARRYRAVAVDHEENTPWREGCCPTLEAALLTGAIAIVHASENRDELGFALVGERQPGDEPGEEKLFPVRFCPLCGGELVFKVVLHFRRRYTMQRVQETVTREEWSYKDEPVPVVV